MFKMGEDIGIDLGTASVLVYIKGQGVVLQEPSVVAIDSATEKIVAVGEEARQMIGRTPGNIIAIRPLREGVIADYDITEKMLKYFIKKAMGTSKFFKPRIMICIPSGVTGVEERAVKQAAFSAGAKQAYLIEEPVAAALGSGLDISQPSGAMVIDIGGGTTDVAVLSLGGVVYSNSVRIGGDKFDEAIIRYVRRKHNVLIGERSAEDVKIAIGSAYPSLHPGQTAEVKGRDLVTGLPRIITLTVEEVNESIAEPLESIVAVTREVLEKTPPELAGDIINKGIILTGGGSLLHGLDSLISERTGLHVYIPEDAISCVAIGTGFALENIDKLTYNNKPQV